MNEITIVEKINNSVQEQFLLHYKDLSNKSVLLAVSGGVDSMVMLHSVYEASKKLNFCVNVITVNHNIRPLEESQRDVNLVQSECNKLKIPCYEKTFEPNYLQNKALERKKGIEEAARFYRYAAFNEIKELTKSSIVCIAHNQNDQLETLLMRFLQGSFVQSGIKTVRDHYFRPLLSISRANIEEYAKALNIPFCIDSTNSDNTYRRNNIRNQIMPILDSTMPQWKTSVLNGAQKANDLQNLLDDLTNQFEWKIESKDCVYFDKKEFTKLQDSLKINLLYKGISLINECEIRFPYKLLKEFSKNFCKVSSCSIVISAENNKIYVRKDCKNQQTGYLTFIQNEGVYNFDFGEVVIKSNARNCFNAILENENFISPDFFLPIIIRSKDSFDKILAKEKNYKKISKIFSEWKVAPLHKNIIPIFENSKICGIWGEPFGYKNFFVKTEDL